MSLRSLIGLVKYVHNILQKIMENSSIVKKTIYTYTDEDLCQQKIYVGKYCKQYN